VLLGLGMVILTTGTVKTCQMWCCDSHAFSTQRPEKPQSREEEGLQRNSCAARNRTSSAMQDLAKNGIL